MKHLTAIVLASTILWSSPLHGEPLSRDELVQALRQRDEAIAALQARVAALEHQQADRTAQGAANADLSKDRATAPASAYENDEAVALQALSRTLVERGGLLLPAGRVELIPSVAYSNREVQGLVLAETPEGIPTVADQRLREDRLHSAMALRVGLPWSSQVEVRVPYEWRRTSRSLGDGTHASNTGNGIGDIEVTVSHQFLREREGWQPALIGGFSWRFATGQDPFRARVPSVASGSGSDELRAHLTAIKSSDPLVFFATLAYAHDLSSKESFGRVRPGDSVELDLGTVLAVNPDTTMTFGLSQEFRGRTNVDGQSLPGTDTVASTLLLGLGRVLSPKLLLDLSLGVGLTRDTPDYALQLSLPYRF